MGNTDKIRILIVEDDALIAADLRKILVDQGFYIVGIAYNAVRALSLIREQRPDLVLIDISLDDETDGIELAHIVNHKYDVPYIFVTSYYDDNTLALVKQTNPVGYILKPFDERDLKVGIQLGLAKHAGIATSLQATNKLYIKEKSGLIGILPSDILFVEANDNYCFLQTKDQKHIVHQTLKSLKHKLSRDHFFQSHRSFLINFLHVDTILENYIVIGSHKIPIGKTHKKELMEYLQIL